MGEERGATSSLCSGRRGQRAPPPEKFWALELAVGGVLPPSSAICRGRDDEKLPP